MTRTLLHIDSSARVDGSHSRALTAKLVDVLSPSHDEIVRRDVGLHPPSTVSKDWIAANFTDEGERTAEQREILSESDALIDELVAADTLVIAAPMYNFAIPAALKAWIDQVARARKTFMYTENGPVGLLKDKKVYVVITSGGVETGSAADFVTPYMRHILGFLGLTDVEVIEADQLLFAAEPKLAEATRQIEAAAA